MGEALAGAPLDNAPKEYPPKIQQLVQDIASLTLLEISDLNELLKVPQPVSCPWSVWGVLPGYKVHALRARLVVYLWM